jgi:hypothetical protein
VDGIDADPYRNLIRATETHVKLVVVRGEPLYGDVAVMRSVKTYRVSLPDGATKLTRQYEFLRPRLADQRQKAVDFKRAGVEKGDIAAADMMERLERAMQFNRRTLRQRIAAAQVKKDLEKCKSAPAPASPPSAEDFQRFLKCQFPGGLPATPLDPLFTVADDDFFRRLEANPNIPPQLRGIREFYHTP